MLNDNIPLQFQYSVLMKYVELARVDRRRLFVNDEFSFEKRHFILLLFVIH